MKHPLIIILILCLQYSANVLASEKDYTLEEVVYSQKHGLKGYLARPEGKGPFPVAVYHHGGL